VEHPAVSAMLTELRGTRAVLFGAFRVVGGVETRREFHDYDLFDHFLGSEALREELPELEVPVPLGEEFGLERLKREFDFARSGPGTLTLDGELAAMLRGGGARFRFQGTPTEAKRIGTAFVDALVGERHDDFEVYRSGCAWTRWFWDIAWDSTLLLIDARRAEIFLLCLTDTD